MDLPLFYFLTYEKAAADGEAYAFICGRLLSFEEMEEYQVYGDDQYVCYEVSGLIYSDLGTYVERYAAQNSLVRLDEQTKMRVENIYHYYKENLVLSYR